MAKYPGFFVNVMMNEELELQVPDPDDSPWKSGFVTFAAFVVFGVVPLLGYTSPPYLPPGHGQDEVV